MVKWLNFKKEDKAEFSKDISSKIKPNRTMDLYLQRNPGKNILL